ncbi:MAG: DegQ family serine endoprotease [Sterolibacterium sp.]|nr:DegQ family serine endoprotease [Sterolibacterium sp.]
MQAKQPHTLNPTLKRSLLASLLLSALLGGGYLVYGKSPISEAWCAPREAAPASVSPSAATLAARQVALPDFTEIVAQHGPAVVNISVNGSVKTRGGSSPMPQMDPDDPFYEFFRRFQAPAPRGQMPIHGQGSGFIISADGMLLTNAHVVADADEVTVKLTDKREFKAKVLGIDKPTDVAVLKIDAKNLPTVKIGSSMNSRVGEWVVAIGAPFGFENSVTAGIVSAKSRSLPDEGYVPFLQTDVPINPGNSGGPLFNMNGEVIGINSQIYSRSGGYQGLSFAIPIDVAMKVQQQLLAHGKVSRGRIGVMIQDMNQDLAESFNLDKPRGALVSSVEKGSPAQKAGIEPGDVILKFNGQLISRSSELPPLVSEQAPGSSATLELWRQGKLRELVMKLGEVDSPVAQHKTMPGNSSKLGLAVRPLSTEERKNADVVYGLVIEEVATTGPATQAGLRRGDIILSVNGEKLSSAEQLRVLVEKNGKHLALQIQRGDNRMFVPLRIK